MKSACEYHQQQQTIHPQRNSTLLNLMFIYTIDNNYIEKCKYLSVYIWMNLSKFYKLTNNNVNDKDIWWWSNFGGWWWCWLSAIFFVSEKCNNGKKKCHLVITYIDRENIVIRIKNQSIWLTNIIQSKKWSKQDSTIYTSSS